MSGLTMRIRRKNFYSTHKEEALSIGKSVLIAAGDHTVVFPENPNEMNRYDFSRHLGHGFDWLVNKCEVSIRDMLQSSIRTGNQSKAVSTITSHCATGLSPLFHFCKLNLASNNPIKIEAEHGRVSTELIYGFLNHLKSENLRHQRTKFSNAKTVLIDAGCASESDFPRLPFGHKPDLPTDEYAYSVREHKSIVRALKVEVSRILKGSQPIDCQDMCYCATWIAARGGLNKQPTVEIRCDALKPHPLSNAKKILLTYKRRSHKAHVSPIQTGTGNSATEHSTVPLSVATLMEQVVERNLTFREQSDYPNRLFVFPLNKANNIGVLTSSRLSQALKHLVKSHKLVDDHGEELKISFRRLRKSWINRIYELSNQDFVITAALSGNSVNVSKTSYLEAPKGAAVMHAFLGEIRNDELLAPPSDPTVIARCSDPINGQKAPKDGSYCLQVLGCFSCKNFVITGDDLHRMFSVYFHVISLRETMPAKQWKRQYGHIIRTIDDKVSPKFPQKTIDKNRTLARLNPHPAWPRVIIGGAPTTE
jgi:hypothetical protein